MGNERMTDDMRGHSGSSFSAPAPRTDKTRTEEQAPPLLELRAVSVRYPGETGNTQKKGVLHEFSLSVKQGELLCILGPSGCGKTTTLKVAGSFILPNSGHVLLDGVPVHSPDPERVMVFQELDQLFPWKRVLHNVAVGLSAGVSERTGDSVTRRTVGPAEADVLCREALEEVGLAASATLFPYQLSGGMKQRVALARAFVGRPRLLLMDEPFGSVDAPQRHDLQNLLRRLLRDHHGTAVFVTHDLEEALRLGTRILVMGPDGSIRLEEHRTPVVTRSGTRTRVVSALQHTLHGLELPDTNPDR
jgi:NitT/TauT family transport system ATP-binding protein